MDTSKIQERVDQVKWFHSFEVVPGVITKGVSKMTDRVFYFEIPEDLTGKHVLDIGAADGYFSFLAETRGADVVSVDLWPRQSYFMAHELRNSKATFHHMSIYDITPDLGMFDIVFCFGLYYHLKHPMLALEKIASVTKEYAIIESEILPSEIDETQLISQLYPEDGLGKDTTNWWVPTYDTFVETTRAAGFPNVEKVNRYHDKRGIVKGYKGPRTSGKILDEDLIITIDVPTTSEMVSGQQKVTGWATSQIEPDGGIKQLTIYLDKMDSPSHELGIAEYGNIYRADIVKHFGEPYGHCGFEFTWDTSSISQGAHVLYVLGESKRGTWHYRSVPIIVTTGQEKALHRLFVEKDVEIARLQNLVKGYEQGRVMRAMNFVNKTLLKIRR